MYPNHCTLVRKHLNVSPVDMFVATCELITVIDTLSFLVPSFELNLGSAQTIEGIQNSCIYVLI